MQKIIAEVFQKLSDSAPQTPFAAEFWDGAKMSFGHGPEKFRLVLKSERAVKRILSGGSLAFGEEYMAGNIDISGDVQAMLALYDNWMAVAGKLSLGTKTGILLNRIISANTLSGAKKNIAWHYDIGNDFYSLWLDPSMTYSCAYFKDEADSLEAAQNGKYEHICRKLRLSSGEMLLDVGCGWGGMMFYAAKNYGAKCAGYTLSQNQYDYVSERIRNEGLSDKVAVYLKDYRQITGVFDKFVSIGMFEHVGPKFYPVFFKVIRSALKPRGTGVLHTIGTRFDKDTDPFVAKYIFPGGRIPTLAMIADAMSAAGLVFYDIEDLRLHYAKTLDLWTANFEASLPAVARIIARDLKDANKAESFIRMWRLYLNGSAVSFKDAGNRLYQIIFTNGPDNRTPLTRDYVYSF